MLHLPPMPTKSNYKSQLIYVKTLQFLTVIHLLRKKSQNQIRLTLVPRFKEINTKEKLKLNSQYIIKQIIDPIMLSFFRKMSTIDNVQTATATKSPTDNKNSQSFDEGIPIGEEALLKELGYKDAQDLQETLFDVLRSIRDPEKPCTLEDLNVIYEEGIFVLPPTKSNVYVVRVEFNPTVPHCSLATLIGLCIRVKVERSLPHNVKLDIYIKKGAHSTEDEINKQINDKERIAAAMENPNLRELVENCIKDED